MFDLSSSWMEGTQVRAGRLRVLPGRKAGPRPRSSTGCSPAEGQPVAVRVFPGNTADPAAFPAAVTVVRETFGLARW